LTQCHIPEGLNPQLHCHDNLQSFIVQGHLWVHTKHIINLFTITRGTFTNRNKEDMIRDVRVNPNM